MRRLCVIEDSPDLQNLIRLELQGWFELLAAPSLGEAWKLIESHTFDLILLDVHLPDGNGFEFCAKLKSHSNTKDIPVIFLTGKSDPIDKQMGFSIGADDYVVKPFEPIELRARIEARLKRVEPEKKEAES